MPIGVADSWWGEGFASRVMVDCADLEKIAKCFGVPARWWPRTIEGIPKEWWLRFPRFGPEQDDALSKIQAYIVREPGLGWTTVAVARSVTEPGSADDDYHRPLYEDALAACSLQSASGPEVREGPVRVAQRLSSELDSAAVAFWASDEEPALGGVCLLQGGGVQWSASISKLSELRRAALAYLDGSEQEVEFDDDAGWERFWLYRQGQPESCIEESLQSWADARFKDLACGVDWGLDPTTVHPYDFPSPMSEFAEEFVVALNPIDAAYEH